MKAVTRRGKIHRAAKRKSSNKRKRSFTRKRIRIVKLAPQPFSRKYAWRLGENSGVQYDGVGDLSAGTLGQARTMQPAARRLLIYDRRKPKLNPTRHGGVRYETIFAAVEIHSLG
jgi:hypothetical protein